MILPPLKLASLNSDFFTKKKKMSNWDLFNLIIKKTNWVGILICNIITI